MRDWMCEDYFFNEEIYILWDAQARKITVKRKSDGKILGKYMDTFSWSMSRGKYKTNLFYERSINAKSDKVVKIGR